MASPTMDLTGKQLAHQMVLTSQIRRILQPHQRNLRKRRKMIAVIRMKPRNLPL